MSEPGPAAFHRSGTVSRSLLSVTAFTLARPHWKGNAFRLSRTSSVLTGCDQYSLSRRARHVRTCHHKGVLALAVGVPGGGEARTAQRRDLTWRQVETMTREDALVEGTLTADDLE